MRLTLFALFLASLQSPASGQIRSFPHAESFDSALIPALPPGWSTSTARSGSGDFTTTRSVFLSDSCAALSTNAGVAQWLATPALDLRGWDPESLLFYERRSATHTSGLLVEASTDGGQSFPLPLSDTLRNPGTTSYVRRAIPLPGSLAGNAAVVVRWRVTGGGTGTSATLRFDDIVVKARGRADLALAALALWPSAPLFEQEVTVTATVRNAGLDPAEGFAVGFGVDADHDGGPDSAEIAAVIPATGRLASGDSLSVSVPLPPGELTADTLLGWIVFAGDQNPRNDVARLRRTTGWPNGSVVVNEIMYGPSGSDPEWIEVHSTLGNAVDLGSWGLADRSASTPYRLGAGPFWLAPGGYAILTRDSVKFRAAWPSSPGPVYTIGTMPTSLFNNDSDLVVLKDHRLAAIDSLRYRSRYGGGGGVSLERVEPSGSSLDSANWGACSAPSGSTPGTQNYLTPLALNLRAVRLAPAFEADSVLEIALTVANIGRQAVDAGAATLYAFRDGVLQQVADALIASRVEPRDSAVLLFEASSLPPGEDSLLAVVTVDGDLRASDDTAAAVLVVSYPRAVLTASEIMYSPASGGEEYVEFLHLGSVPIDMRGWSLSPHRIARRTINDHAPPVIVSPGEYVVLAADSLLLARFPGAADAGAHLVVLGKSLGLGDGGDTLILQDASGRLIDSVIYSPDWHNPDLEETRGRSLERITLSLPPTDGRNWGTSADPSGGTPGRRNSLGASAKAAGAGAQCSPNPFSPDGDGFEDVTIIAFDLPLVTGTRRIAVYDALGRRVRTLSGEEPTGGSGSMVWDGRDDDGNVVAMGIYVVLIETHDARSGASERTLCPVVVAAKL